MGRVLKAKPEYSCELVDEEKYLYRVAKLVPPDYDEEIAYTVRSGGGLYTCDCYAGLMGKFCRHIQIVDLFKAIPDRLGGRYTYCFDRKEWRK
jgi:hypothetical protein